MELLLLTADPEADSVLPALSMLAHGVRPAAPEIAVLVDASPYDAVLVDARVDLVGSRSLCWMLLSMGLDVPLVVVISEGGLVALSVDWGFDEILLSTAGPAEVEARFRLVVPRRATQSAAQRARSLVLGALAIDEATYTARLHGRPLDLTYKEFELLKYLAQHAGQVLTRAQLLAQVWGYDFFGTRTIDVHVRRLRAKLGPEHDQLIATVRNVGYKFIRPIHTTNSRQRPKQEPATNTNSTNPITLGHPANLPRCGEASSATSLTRLGPGTQAMRPGRGRAQSR